MQDLARGSKRPRNQSSAESEERRWQSDEAGLLDPAVKEPRMVLASADSEAGWGFHARAERLNGRLAMLGFTIGVLIEWLTGQGIAQQIGLSALRHHP